VDEIDFIQQQIQALIAVRKFLLNQQPSDMVALAAVTEKIVDRNAALGPLINATDPLPNIPLSRQKALEDAVRDLARAMEHSAGASQIMSGVTVLLKA
jgi:hypothetical protein